MAAQGQFIHHSLLGHVPNPGFCGSGFGTSFHTIDGNGLRSCGEANISCDDTILAVGDSYTYGDEVRDEESWPSQLQRLTGRRVLNGGVTGYGFDQIVLRAEALAALYKPSVVIVSFVADDMRRTEMRRLWWRNKPWFSIENDQLVLNGVPVPDPPGLPPRLRLRAERALLKLPDVVQQLAGYHRRVHPEGFGVVIARRLTERLARMQADLRVKVVVMAQYVPDFWRYRTLASDHRLVTRAIFDVAAQYGLATQDTFPRLVVEPRPLDFYGHFHMNARGNLAVASLLAARLPALTNHAPS